MSRSASESSTKKTVRRVKPSTPPLVSVIVTTRNNQPTIEACLASIAAQTYPAIEIIVVDNSSRDDTLVIARRFTDNVFTKGPERSAQRNFAVKKARGAFVLIIDSDMELEPDVVASCLQTVTEDPAFRALIIPEESFGEGFWARCKSLERSFYVGVDAIEAARFFDKALYERVGGYNERLTGGEDWDLTNRVRKVADVGRSGSLIHHNEGRLHFRKTLGKMYYYASHANAYFAENPTNSALTDKSGPLARYKLFFSRPKKLFKNPLLGFGMLTLKTSEYAAGALGYVRAKKSKSQAADQAQAKSGGASS